MTIRKITFTLFAAVIASASFAAAASAATTPHHRHSTMSHAMKGHSAMHQDAGSAATDALNEQSLSSARSGAAPAMGMPSGAAPAGTAQ